MLRRRWCASWTASKSASSAAFGRSAPSGAWRPCRGTPPCAASGALGTVVQQTVVAGWKWLPCNGDRVAVGCLGRLAAMPISVIGPSYREDERYHGILRRNDDGILDCCLLFRAWGAQVRKGSCYKPGRSKGGQGCAASRMTDLCSCLCTPTPLFRLLLCTCSSFSTFADPAVQQGRQPARARPHRGHPLLPAGRRPAPAEVRICFHGCPAAAALAVARSGCPAAA